jgi:hypothetical protein
MRMASGDDGFSEILAQHARQTWVETVEQQRQQMLERLQQAVGDQCPPQDTNTP